MIAIKNVDSELKWFILSEWSSAIEMYGQCKMSVSKSNGFQCVSRIKLLTFLHCQCVPIDNFNSGPLQLGNRNLIGIISGLLTSACDVIEEALFLFSFVAFSIHNWFDHSLKRSELFDWESVLWYFQFYFPYFLFLFLWNFVIRVKYPKTIHGEGSLYFTASILFLWCIYSVAALDLDVMVHNAITLGACLKLPTVYMESTKCLAHFASLSQELNTVWNSAPFK